MQSSKINEAEKKNNNQNVLHISHYSVRIKGLISRFVECFPHINHYFYISGNQSRNYLTVSGENIFFEKDGADLDKLLSVCDLVILHGISNDSCKRLRSIVKVASEKNIVWAVWGHDVYDAYWTAHRINIKHPLLQVRNIYFECLRKKLIARVKIIHAVPGDYEAIKKWYKTSAKYIFFNQVSYGEKENAELDEKVRDPRKLKVMVGHAPYSHCRHIETLQLLKTFDDGKMEVYCPLFYSGKQPRFVGDVIRVGKELFFDRFFAETEFMEYMKYCKWINEMDVALFNHNRQMAEGNVLMLLYYGKKVFVSDENCIGDFFRVLGAKVFRMKDLSSDSLFEDLEESEKQLNKKVILDNMTEEAFKKNWQEILR